MQEKNRMSFVADTGSFLHALCDKNACLYVKKAKLLQVLPCWVVAFDKTKKKMLKRAAWLLEKD